MPEYRIEYTKIPTNHNDTRLMFIEATTANAALIAARLKLERTTRTPAMDYVWGKPEAIDLAFNPEK